MSTYQELKGLKVKYLSSDTSGDRIKEGEVFYNSTDFNLKAFVSTAAWHSGANLTVARERSGNFGPVTAGICCGGFTSVPDGTPSKITTTEHYNGTGWSSGGNMNTGRSEHLAYGTQTAGLAAGGGGPLTANSEEYNGTAWTEGSNMGTARSDFAFQFGVQTAAVGAGGYVSGASALNEEYDGTSWSEVNNIPTATFQGGGLGTLTAGLGFGGYTTTTVAEGFSYDGTNWTASSDLNLARRVRITNFGESADDGFVYGGLTPAGNRQTTGAQWNGTSWTAAPASTGIGKQNSHGAGTASSTAAWAAAGNVAPNNVASTTEEFTVSLSATTAAAWASGGNLNTARSNAKGGGTQTSAVVFGGQVGPPNFSVRAETEEYDGSSWTESGDMSNARREHAGFGIQTAAVAFGGENPGDAQMNATENYNGSSWTSSGTYPLEIGNHGATGTQTAGLCAGGSTPPGVRNLTCEYDGSSWTSTAPGGNIGTARYGGELAGTQTAGLLFGGSPPRIGLTEEYDGSSWTAGGSMNLKLRAMGGAGTQTAALSFGGAPGDVTSTEGYDGTSWSTRPDMASGRSYLGGCGTQTLALAMGNGSTPTAEEFTGETTAARAVKTIDFD